MEESITIDFCGRPLTISTGPLAKQADGSVINTVRRYGGAGNGGGGKGRGDHRLYAAHRQLPGDVICGRQIPGRFFQEGRASLGKRSAHLPPDRQAAPPLVREGLPPARPRSLRRCSLRTRRTTRPCSASSALPPPLRFPPYPFSARWPR